MKASFADPSRGFETDYGFDVRKPVEWNISYEDVRSFNSKT